MARITKRAIYESFGIEYRTRDSRIYCDPLQRWIKPVLKNGNKKIGKGVWQFSITAGNKAVSDEVARRVVENVETDMRMDVLRMACGGTCNLSCPGCYAQTGCYMFFSTRLCLATHTYLARLALEWLERAIMAQIKADKIHYLRVHVSGDMVSKAYAEMWCNVAEAYTDTVFWTYTKQYGMGFDDVLNRFAAMPNCNIVESFVGKYINFGKARYIIDLYKKLVANDESVYICRCGVDPNQHCTNCHHCATTKYVLFLEHSTDYKPENDPDFAEFKAIVEAQKED